MSRLVPRPLVDALATLSDLRKCGVISHADAPVLRRAINLSINGPVTLGGDVQGDRVVVSEELTGGSR